MKRFSVVVGSLLMGSVLWAAPGDFGYQGFGFRVGVSVDPDQVYGGIHWDIGSSSSSIHIRPNLELGVGDDELLLAANGEVLYYFKQQGEWIPYAGGALSINFIDRDKPKQFEDDSDVELGFYAVGGLDTALKGNRRLLLEAKLGFSDSPDLKIGIGWTF